MSNHLFDYTDTYEYMERLKQGLPPLIICVAVNGGIQGKEYNPNIPETPEEISDAVYDAYCAGASMAHIHARDPHNLPRATRSEDDWCEVLERIRQRCPDIILNATTGGDLEMTMEERLCCLKAKPDVASLNLTPDMCKFQLKERKAPLPHPREAYAFDGCLPFSYQQIEWYAKEMLKHGVKPELETYHSGGAAVMKFLIDHKLVEPPYWIQTVMGYQTASWPTVENVIQLVREFPKQTSWLCSGIGPHQLPMTTLAILMGGHVRVGLEDNVYFKRGELATSNAQLVARTVRIAQELNRPIATAVEARAMLGLKTNVPAHA